MAGQLAAHHIKQKDLVVGMTNYSAKFFHRHHWPLTLHAIFSCLDLGWGSQGQQKAKSLWIIFLHASQLVRRKFVVVMKQFKISILLLFRVRLWYSKKISAAVRIVPPPPKKKNIYIYIYIYMWQCRVVGQLIARWWCRLGVYATKCNSARREQPDKKTHTTPSCI